MRQFFKRITIFAFVILTLSMSLNVFAADEKQHPCVIQCNPVDISTYDYSIIQVVVVNNETGDTHRYKLTSYNYFRDTVLLPYGSYSILSSKIENRQDIVFYVDSVYEYEHKADNDKIIYNLYDTNLIQGVTETTIVKFEKKTKKKVYSLEDFYWEYGTPITYTLPDETTTQATSVTMRFREEKTYNNTQTDNSAESDVITESATSPSDNSNEIASTKKKIVISFTIGLAILIVLWLLQRKKRGDTVG